MASPDVATFKQWNAQQFAAYMRDTCNLGQYYEAIISNDIGGDTAPRLTENDLKVRKRIQCKQHQDGFSWKWKAGCRLFIVDINCECNHFLFYLTEKSVELFVQ